METSDLYKKVKEYIKKHHDDELVFFQVCYQWRFKKYNDCVADLCIYRLHAIVPRYVEEFIRFYEEV